MVGHVCKPWCAGRSIPGIQHPLCGFHRHMVYRYTFRWNTCTHKTFCFFVVLVIEHRTSRVLASALLTCILILFHCYFETVGHSPGCCWTRVSLLNAKIIVIYPYQGPKYIKLYMHVCNVCNELHPHSPSQLVLKCDLWTNAENFLFLSSPLQADTNKDRIDIANTRAKKLIDS